MNEQNILLEMFVEHGYGGPLRQQRPLSEDAQGPHYKVMRKVDIYWDRGGGYP